MVEAALRERPGPLQEWSAIVHDDGTEIDVTTGRREELIDKLREFAGPAPHTADGQLLERCAREIEDNPKKVPVFSIDQEWVCLEFVTERSIGTADGVMVKVPSGDGA